MRHIPAAGRFAAPLLIFAFATAPHAGGQTVKPGSAIAHRHATAMDPDHHFLRDLADHNEAMVHLAHSAMEMKHMHAGGSDAAGATDVAEDARKAELVSLLRARFNDRSDPSIPAPLRQQVDSLMKLEGESYETALADFTRRHHQAAIEMIDHAKLRRSEVKSLAKRMRAQYVREIGAASAARQ